MSRYLDNINGINMIKDEEYLIDGKTLFLKEFHGGVVKNTFCFYSTHPYSLDSNQIAQKISNGTFEKVEMVVKPNRNTGFISRETLDKIHHRVSLLGWLDNKEPTLRVYYNDKKKATTLIQGDKVVVVKTKKDEKYNRRIGFLEAYFELKSGMSKTQKNKYLDKIVDGDK